jgi:serralysin
MKKLLLLLMSFLFVLAVTKDIFSTTDDFRDTGSVTTDSYKPTKVERDNNNDGIIDEVYIFTYDSNGNRTKYEEDSDNNGIIDVTYVYSYDANNYLTGYTENEDGNGPFDTHSYTLNASGLPVMDKCDKDSNGTVDYIITYTYDSNGYPTGLEFDNATSVSSIQYYLWGNNFDCPENMAYAENFDIIKLFYLKKQLGETSRNSSGTLSEYQYTFTIDGTNCNDTHTFIEELDNLKDGTIDVKQTYSYDANSYLYRLESDIGNDGAIDRVQTFTYNANGNRTKHETDYDNDGVVDRVKTFIYDAIGKMTKKKTDRDGDGVVDEIGTYTYDANGLPKIYEEDDDNDGTIDWVEYVTWAFETDPNVSNRKAMPWIPLLLLDE